MGGCVLWGFAGFVEDRLNEPINTAGDYFKSDALVATVSLACILTTLVAGLGLLGTGLGLQGENRSSGQWALVVTGVLAAVWWGGAVTFWMISAPIWKIIVGFAVDDAQGRLDNGVGLLLVEQPEVAVGLGGGLFDQAERLDKATRKALATDGKVVNGTLGLRAV